MVNKIHLLWITNLVGVKDAPNRQSSGSNVCTFTRKDLISGGRLHYANDTFKTVSINDINPKKSHSKCIIESQSISKNNLSISSLEIPDKIFLKKKIMKNISIY